MERNQRKSESQNDTAAVARKPDPGSGHGRDNVPGPVQRAPVTGAEPASSAGAWEADEGLLSAMGIGDAVQRKRVEETQSPDSVQAQAGAGVASGGGAVPFQAKMEDAFGTSFAGVNAHVGGAAADSCEAMGAQAYATGNNVAFKKDPDESLVAHELTHVLQQRAGAQQKGVGESPELEAEADAVGSRVAAGGSVADVAAKYTGGAEAARVQRKEEEANAQADSAAGEGPEEEEPPPTAEAGAEAEAEAGPGGGAAAEQGAEGGGAKAAATPAKPAASAAGKPPKRPGEKEPPKEDMQPKGDAPQLAKDTTWGGNYVEVQDFPGGGADFIGNVSAGHKGEASIKYGYWVRNLYLGDTTGGLDYQNTNVKKKGHPVSGGDGGLKFGASLPHTKPGMWSAWIHNPGGVVADSMHAESAFLVVNPVTLKSRKAERTVYDFENPIPIQMTGDSELKFRLSKSMVQSKRVAVGSGGSASTSATEKMSFGVALKLDNDAGSEGGGEWGMSSASTEEFKKQWSKEKYSSTEISGEGWMEATYHPSKNEKGRSKMLVPTYTWVEWVTEVYPHDPANLKVTGAKKEATVGMLLPTGKFEELRSTDPGEQSNAKPTADAEVDPTDMAHNPSMEKSYEDARPEAQGWETMPGARWADQASTLQFIKGPVVNDPAERDYGIQEGHAIHPGNDKESISEGSSFQTSAEDGLTASTSQESSSVTTNSVSKSFEGMPGIKGIGQIGANLKFENEGSLGASTGTTASASASSKTTTTVSISHTITKSKKNQFVVYTPLYTHKVFRVAWGARKPTTGNTVDPETVPNTGYIHVFKHTPIPHVKVFDTPTKNPKIKLGLHSFPDHVDV